MSWSSHLRNIFMAIMLSVAESLQERIDRDGCSVRHQTDDSGCRFYISSKRWDFDTDLHLYLSLEFGSQHLAIVCRYPPLSADRVTRIYTVDYCDPELYAKVATVYDQAGIVRCD